MEIISTTALCKRFGETYASNAISLSVKQGEIYGFLGLNGAGKTTLIRMLLGMITPDSGHIKLFGKEVNRKFDQWNDIGYLVETPYSYPDLSILENLKIHYLLRKLKQPQLIDEILEKLKLSKYKHKKAKELSLGNQQRLGLAKALMHKPKLLVLDEPINGLDPEGIVEVRELLQSLAQQGTTVFLSSHILGEISKIANEIAIIHNGKLVTELSAKALNKQLQKKLVLSTLNNELASKHLTDAGFSATLNAQNKLEITESKAFTHSEEITQFLTEKSLPPKEIYQFSEDLEMFFLRTIK